MKLLHIVGARPNFMKLAPVYQALQKFPIQQFILHTGQHYDTLMSDIFFQELEIPNPDYNLGVGSGSHTQQTAKAMLGMEEIILALQPDGLVVYGDINATLSATLVCAKLQIPIAHVEAGLRSFDRTMPEEINRIITDRLADLLFTPSMDGNENLAKEGIESHKIHLVGNVMIDTLVKSLGKINQNPKLIENALHIQQNILSNQAYCLATIHRPSNVDNPENLKKLILALLELAQQLPIIFPIHPRTRKQLETHQILPKETKNFHLIEPQGYFDFLYLQKNAKIVLTDSGGVQEETTFLQIPCFTLRANTERPITISRGTNMLVGNDYDLLKNEFQKVLHNQHSKGNIPELWDGKASERIAQIICEKNPQILSN